MFEGWDGGRDELAVELPGRLECLDPVLLHASSFLLQQVYNLGLVGDIVIRIVVPWEPLEDADTAEAATADGVETCIDVG